MRFRTQLLAGACGTLIASAVFAAPKPNDWWSLRPLEVPEVLPVRQSRWALSPIDRFILAKLEHNKMHPAKAADKSTLLRRVYFNLIGIPPTSAEMKAFLEDTSARAYERVVDSLLASPRYGERWARHWLDAVHYAETHGHDQDRPRTNSWPYRDYVVRSFNEDKPYSRFVEEQIAGDALFPDDPWATVAMGFLATGPWDESSLRDIREDVIDRQVARYLDRDDIVMTTMNTFVSATVQCARCHDHKFDPVSQEEYYGLQAVFAATDKANRIYDPDPATHVRRRELRARQKAISRKEPALLATMSTQDFARDLAAWETRRAGISWSILKPVAIASVSNASTLTLQSDGSILASGETPLNDVYTLTFDSGGPITAIRLEVMPDETLPAKGPGRAADNGNFHLTGIQLKAVAEGKTNVLALDKASADFNQKDWEIEKAIDSDPKTGWGIFPEGGKSHVAVLELKTALDAAASLILSLEQNHGRKHLIGRFRVSATSAAKPVSSTVVVAEIARTLELPSTERSEAQATGLAWYFLKQQVDHALDELGPPALIYAGASDFTPDGSFKPAAGPRAVHVLKRGDIRRPGDAAIPRALECVSTLASHFQIADEKDEASRRVALAKWITHHNNTLTWRSIVNRVWHFHFGRGLVETPNDFGRMGAPPSHPELLDWLAVTFRDSGGSLKQLHKLIVTSAAYQQSCAHNERFARIDSSNRLLWRMNRTRLDADALRDSVLHIAGHLDFQMGGPSAQQFVMTPGLHATPNVDYAKFDVDSPASRRRSIYRFIFRTLPDPFMDSLDCADASQLTPARNVSMTALQALALLNNPFMVRQCEHFAQRVAANTSDVESQITLAYELALNRRPRRGELIELARYARKHGLANACRVILNGNEFMFVN